MSGKIIHTTAGRKLTQAEYEANTAHSLEEGHQIYAGQLGASAYVVASNTQTWQKNFASMLQSEGFPVYVCDNTADNVEIQAAIDA